MPFRPILSAICTHTYNLSKFLVSSLTPLLSSLFMINDTFSFLEELRSFNFDTDKDFMASFDVNLLFTNIPLDETVDVVVNKAFNNSALYNGFSALQFHKLLCLSVKNCFFLFNNCLYKQIDGVAMGSPLGPYFANTFLSFHERNWIANCPPEFKPLFFRRYVDDCFAIFSSPDHVPPFHEYLNSQHPNISFICEFENNSALSFLDILIDCWNGFSTSVYQKPSFTGLFTHFDSFIPISYKRGLVYTLVNHYQLFHSELLNLKNGYPNTFLDSCIRVLLINCSVRPHETQTHLTKLFLNFLSLSQVHSTNPNSNW